MEDQADLNKTTYARTSKFQVEDIEEAALVLSHVLRAVDPTYSSLGGCQSLLTRSKPLHEALKIAHAQQNYDIVRNWDFEKLQTPLPRYKSSPHDLRLDDEVECFLDELLPSMSKLVKGEIPLWCTWSPDANDMEPSIAAHLTALRIPNWNSKPNLLFHDLGSFNQDPVLKSRLNDIFMEGKHTFLVNTSGSGKTRLVFEGLCQHWGFYFTSDIDSSGTGSSDVHRIIRNNLPRSIGFRRKLPPAGSPDYDDALESNRTIAHHRFSQVLLARLFIFRMFIRIMRQGEVTEKHKHRWLLLQLQPSLLNGLDIFELLTSKLAEAGEDYLSSTITDILMEVLKLCDDQGSKVDEPQTKLYCVLDEAQYAATQHSSAFRSKDDKPRPVLREIVRAWDEQVKGRKVFMVVAGTGISQNTVDQAMMSAVMKQPMFRWCSNTGAFDEREVQRRYLLKYLPPTLANSAAGERLLCRAWLWLHGRHRFTAEFTALLLENGFRRPHTLLNDYVENFTKFLPTDALDFVDEGGPIGKKSLPSHQTLDFSKLEKNTSMMITIHRILFHYLMRGELPRCLGEDEREFVEYGFARFPDPNTVGAALDEPLVLLAVAKWFNDSGHSLASHKYFAREINHTNANPNGFENYVAFYLTQVLNGNRNLCDVFKFGGNVPSWARQSAELVGLHTPEDMVEEGVIRHYKFSGSQVTLGTNALALDSTFLWLDLRRRTPFCFPSTRMGPDLLFALKLSDGTAIWVALQAKCVKRLAKDSLRSYIRAVTPSKFFYDKNDNPYKTIEYPTPSADTLKCLRALPHRRSEDAGEFGLLRVIAAFPGEPKLERCLHEDTDAHPIASLNIELFKVVIEGLSPMALLESVAEKVSGNRKKIHGSKLRDAPKRIDTQKRKEVPDGKDTGKGAKRQKVPEQVNLQTNSTLPRRSTRIQNMITNA